MSTKASHTTTLVVDELKTSHISTLDIDDAVKGVLSRMVVSTHRGRPETSGIIIIDLHVTRMADREQNN